MHISFYRRWELFLASALEFKKKNMHYIMKYMYVCESSSIYHIKIKCFVGASQYEMEYKQYSVIVAASKGTLPILLTYVFTTNSVILLYGFSLCAYRFIKRKQIHLKYE